MALTFWIIEPFVTLIWTVCVFLVVVAAFLSMTLLCSNICSETQLFWACPAAAGLERHEIPPAPVLPGCWLGTISESLLHLFLYSFYYFSISVTNCRSSNSRRFAPHLIMSVWLCLCHEGETAIWLLMNTPLSLALHPPCLSCCHLLVIWCFSMGSLRPRDVTAARLPPELLVFQTELEEYFRDFLLFRTLLPTQTHSCHLMDQTHTHSHISNTFGDITSISWRFTFTLNYNDLHYIRKVSPHKWVSNPQFTQAHFFRSLNATHQTSADLHLSFRSLCGAVGLRWAAECVWLFFYSSDPDVNILLQNSVTFTPMLVQTRFYMQENTRTKKRPHTSRRLKNSN